MGNTLSKLVFVIVLVHAKLQVQHHNPPRRLPEKGSLTLFFRVGNQSPQYVEVDAEATVADLKAAIQTQMSGDYTPYELSHAGVPLADDAESLADAGVARESEISLSPKKEFLLSQPGEPARLMNYLRSKTDAFEFHLMYAYEARGKNVINEYNVKVKPDSSHYSNAVFVGESYSFMHTVDDQVLDQYQNTDTMVLSLMRLFSEPVGERNVLEFIRMRSQFCIFRMNLKEGAWQITNDSSRKMTKVTFEIK